MRRTLIGVVSLIAIAGCGGSGPASEHLRGDVLVVDRLTYVDSGDVLGSSCEGQSGFSDLRDGAQVVVKDGEGTIVGTARLGSGKLANDGHVNKPAADACQFAFDLSIPRRDYYSVEVASRVQTVARRDLEQAGWQIHLTLGG